MSFQGFSKKFKRVTARYGLFASAWLLERLPYSAVRLLARMLVAVGFRFVIKQRRIACESLQIAFGAEKSPQEIQGIVRRCFANLGQGMVEMLYFMAHPALTDEKVSFEGRHHLDEAIKQGRGVIAVTAHFGNFPLMMLYCARQGYKTSAIIRPARDRELEDYLLRKRTACGLKTIYAVPRRECVVNSLKALSGNEILFIPLDQNFGADGGVFVDFFGQKAATATGPVVFARRSKAPILPMFIIRQDDDTHKIVIEPPLVFEEGPDEPQEIIVNTARITKLIEQYIRRYPQEWGWMHRRWKSRPPTVSREA
jgi:KDO2-lipid IV(A) lauroyltransferase